MEDNKLLYKNYYIIALLIFVNIITFSIIHSKYKRLNDELVNLKDKVSQFEIL